MLAEYAKADTDDICIRITASNRGPERAGPPPPADALVPEHVVLGMQARGLQPEAQDPPGRRDRVECDHETLGMMILDVGGELPALPPLLFTENETNAAAPLRRTNNSPYVKDAIGDYRRRGRIEAANPNAGAPNARPNSSWTLGLERSGACACGCGQVTATPASLLARRLRRV